MLLPNDGLAARGRVLSSDGFAAEAGSSLLLALPELVLPELVLPELVLPELVLPELLAGVAKASSSLLSPELLPLALSRSLPRSGKPLPKAPPSVDSLPGSPPPPGAPVLPEPLVSSS